MKSTVLCEHGYDEALFGLGLSYGKTSDKSYLSFVSSISSEMSPVAERLAGKGEGHDKFLRMISVWMDIDAPMYWWKEFDTYKIGTTAQSESTMHTILRRQLKQDDFEATLGPLMLHDLNMAIVKKDFDAVIKTLPMSFLQRRIVSMNYAVLQNIIRQRTGHKLPEWKVFIDSVMTGVAHPELLK